MFVEQCKFLVALDNDPLLRLSLGPYLRVHRLSSARSLTG